jgi:hypothetical protein
VGWNGVSPSRMGVSQEETSASVPPHVIPTLRFSICLESRSREIDARANLKPRILMALPTHALPGEHRAVGLSSAPSSHGPSEGPQSSRIRRRSPNVATIAGQAPRLRSRAMLVHPSDHIGGTAEPQSAPPPPPPPQFPTDPLPRSGSRSHQMSPVLLL